MGIGKKIVGDKAEKWLAIHGANCYAVKVNGTGLDKQPFTVRTEWVEENEDNTLKLGRCDGSFEDLPEELEEWWLTADKPWGSSKNTLLPGYFVRASLSRFVTRTTTACYKTLPLRPSSSAGKITIFRGAPWAFLAWAHDWAQYKAAPATHLSHLPIDVDGRSNGYQHMAGLLKSKNIAEWENMLQVDKPKDIYSHVATEAKQTVLKYKTDKCNIAELYAQYNETRESKSKNDNAFDELNAQILAHSLVADLPRSSAKKVIMTYPYSASVRKMANVIMKEEDVFQKWSTNQLDPKFNDRARKGIRQMDPCSVIKSQNAKRLTKIIRNSIDRLYPEIPSLLSWFKQIGNLLARKNDAIQWTAPSGFIIQQDYEESKDETIESLGKKYVYKKKTGKSDQGKHTRAIAPNFIPEQSGPIFCRAVSASRPPEKDMPDSRYIRSGL